jgi:bilirubin oxidase
MNERNWQTNPDYPATDRVLRFVVSDQSPTSSDGNGNIPADLVALNRPESHPVIDYSFTFERQNDQWLINGVGFEDIPNRIIAFPKQGRVQRWELINTSGGWSHPIHIHLIDFQVVKRSGGRGAVEPYEAAALKDVVYLGMNERVELISNFAPWSGIYMFHCHNLVHEDHDMMAAFNVSQVDLTSYGYPETTSFIDPMTPAFRAKDMSTLKFQPGTQEYLADIPESVLKKFVDLNAYPDSKGVENALDSYYLTVQTATSTSSTKGGGGKSTTTTLPTPTTLVTSTTSTKSSGQGKSTP